jgi:hypothetical protein
VPDKNGSIIKWGAIGALVALVVGLLTILGFAGKAIDERIDAKIMAYENEMGVVHQRQIADIQQDIAVITVQLQQIDENIEEMKELLRGR